MAEQIVCEVTSADIPAALEALRAADIPIENVIQRGPLTIRFSVGVARSKEVDALLGRRGDRVVLLRRLGLSRRILPWLRHPFLIFGILLILFLTVYLPTKVLFIRVEGNSVLETGFILAKAESCGICFGAERGDVRSEQVKNALLEAIPQLQWTGINTAGCVATISVRERSEEPEAEHPVPSEIVAVCDGVIRSCTAERGTALCKPGQAVRKGQTLISGLTDCGRVIWVSGAEGEVFAETSHSLMVRIGDLGMKRVCIDATQEKISLLIGKKRINFDNDSGILDATCVKMYEEYYITLPGGFRLPLGIARETTVYYRTEEYTHDDGTQLMERCAKEYLLRHMTAGQILEQRITADGNRLYADYICLEMIGRNRYEEFTRQDGENDGENS